MKKKSLLTLLAALLCVASMWASVNADDYKLPGAFSVSSTKVVYFSQGNLQYTKSTGKWKIMDHQYDMVETSSQNVGTNYASQDVVTLFGWGTSGWESDTRTADFPYYTNNNNADYGVLATKSSSETLTDATTNGEKGDWGVFNSGDLGAGWRTLTNAEWGYLFNTRTPGNSVNGVSNARYTEATINTDGTAVNGIILFPDDAVMTSVSGVTWGTINSSSAWGTRCTSAGWTALETAGCVFLPAAGYRLGTTVYYAGIDGYYWSSTAGSASNAYYLYFYSGYVYPQGSNLRFRGYSVRLVSDEAPVTPATVTAAPTAVEGLEYTGAAQALLNNDGVAEGGTLNYSLDNTNWSEAIPTATNAGDYTVYYKVVGDASHADFIPSPNEIAVSIAAPSAVALTANPDPDPLHAGDYYSTFYHSAVAYELSAGVEAYVAKLSADALILTKIAEGGEVIPMDNAVILKSNSSAITLTPSDATPVSFTATNNLHGVDAPTAAPANCYVLSGHSSDNSVTGVGFYQYTGTLKAHKAYAVIDAGIAYAPKKLRFVFNQEQTTTDVDQITNDQSPMTNKVIKDGVLYIEKNGVRYNAQGQIIK